MEEALRTLMLGNAGISARVGTRITWGERLQGSAVPAINMDVASKLTIYHMTGASSYNKYRVQINCYGNSYADAKLTSRAVSDFLSTYQAGDFQGIFEENAPDRRIAGSNDADKLFGVSQDYQIHHS